MTGMQDVWHQNWANNLQPHEWQTSIEATDLQLVDIFVQAHIQLLCLLHQDLRICNQPLHHLRPLCMLLQKDPKRVAGNQ